MGSDAEFAKWVNEEVAINIMQKLAKTMTFDLNVSVQTLSHNNLSLFV